MIETPEEFAKRYWNSLAPHYSEHRKTLAYFIAEHDAELTAAIREECAKRAIAWRHKKYSCTVPGVDEELCAAIVGKEGE